MKISKTVVLDDLFRTFIVVISAAIFAVSIIWFIEPAALISTGITGISQICNRLFLKADIEIPIGVFTFLFNVPICIIGVVTLSKRFVIFSIVSVIVQSVLFLGFIPEPHFVKEMADNKLLMVLIGGLISGVAIGIALRYGTSTGGSDILAQAFSLKKGISIGLPILISDIIIALVGGIIEHDAVTTLYTFIYTIISTLVIDRIHTIYNSIRIDIVTKKKDDLAKVLIERTSRSCSSITIQGMYTGQEKNDLFIIVSKYEFDKVKRAVHEIDPDAFIVVSPVKQVIGDFSKRTII